MRSGKVSSPDSLGTSVGLSATPSPTRSDEDESEPDPWHVASERFEPQSPAPHSGLLSQISVTARGNPISCMCVDDKRGWLLTGHLSGSVNAWRLPQPVSTHESSDKLSSSTRMSDKSVLSVATEKGDTNSDETFEMSDTSLFHHSTVSNPLTPEKKRLVFEVRQLHARGEGPVRELFIMELPFSEPRSADSAEMTAKSDAKMRHQKSRDIPDFAVASDEDMDDAKSKSHVTITRRPKVAAPLSVDNTSDLRSHSPFDDTHSDVRHDGAAFKPKKTKTKKKMSAASSLKSVHSESVTFSGITAEKLVVKDSERREHFDEERYRLKRHGHDEDFVGSGLHSKQKETKKKKSPTKSKSKSKSVASPKRTGTERSSTWEQLEVAYRIVALIGFKLIAVWDSYRSSLRHGGVVQIKLQSTVLSGFHFAQPWSIFTTSCKVPSEFTHSGDWSNFSEGVGLSHEKAFFEEYKLSQLRKKVKKRKSARSRQRHGIAVTPLKASMTEAGSIQSAVTSFASQSQYAASAYISPKRKGKGIMALFTPEPEEDDSKLTDGFGDAAFSGAPFEDEEVGDELCEQLADELHLRKPLHCVCILQNGKRGFVRIVFSFGYVSAGRITLHASEKLPMQSLMSDSCFIRSIRRRKAASGRREESDERKHDGGCEDNYDLHLIGFRSVTSPSGVRVGGVQLRPQQNNSVCIYKLSGFCKEYSDALPSEMRMIHSTGSTRSLAVSKTSGALSALSPSTTAATTPLKLQKLKRAPVATVLRIEGRLQMSWRMEDSQTRVRLAVVRAKKGAIEQSIDELTRGPLIALTHSSYGFLLNATGTWPLFAYCLGNHSSQVAVVDFSNSRVVATLRLKAAILTMDFTGDLLSVVCANRSVRALSVYDFSGYCVKAASEQLSFDECGDESADVEAAADLPLFDTVVDNYSLRAATHLSHAPLTGFDSFVYGHPYIVCRGNVSQNRLFYSSTVGVFCLQL